MMVYVVEDRAPRVYPWVNERDGGITACMKIYKSALAYTDWNTMWCGCVNTGVAS